jgi:hypothetical protein
MLVGDAASPFIPIGLVGHGVVWVKNAGGQIIGPVTKFVGKVAEGLWQYTKKVGENIVEFFGTWFDDIKVFKSAVNIGLDTTKWGDEAINGLEKFASKTGGDKAAKRLGEEVIKKTGWLTEEALEKLFENLQKLADKGVIGVSRLEDEIISNAKTLDEGRLLPVKDPDKINKIVGPMDNLKGLIFEAKANANPKFIDNLQEIRHNVKSQNQLITEFDAILKDNSILEYKQGVPDKTIAEKIDNLNKGKLLENRGNIKIVFENQPSQEVINVLEEAKSEGKLFSWEVL